MVMMGPDTMLLRIVHIIHITGTHSGGMLLLVQYIAN